MKEMRKQGIAPTGLGESAQTAAKVRVFPSLAPYTLTRSPSAVVRFRGPRKGSSTRKQTWQTAG